MFDHMFEDFFRQLGCLFMVAVAGAFVAGFLICFVVL